MISEIEHSRRISEANRCTESYMKSRAKTRKIVLSILDKKMATWLHSAGLKIKPELVDSLKRVLISTFADGFTVGCRTGMAWNDKKD